MYHRAKSQMFLYKLSMTGGQADGQKKQLIGAAFALPKKVRSYVVLGC